jgi:hypothetical protein
MPVVSALKALTHTDVLARQIAENGSEIGQTPAAHFDRNERHAYFGDRTPACLALPNLISFQSSISTGPYILKIKWNAKLLECLFVFAQIFVSKRLETSAAFEMGEKIVNLLPQFVISLANTHCPFFLLKRLKDRPS